MKPYNTHYPSQWGLKNTGQSGGTSGIDIKAEQAWAITRGNANIRVAVIDEGVDLTHPDLQANLLPGFDATVNAPGGANGSSFGNNAHGTACAGIIGAVNNSIGVVGVASNVKIIPVRIAYIATGSNNWTTNDAWTANGINHAWQTAQADVLSCSWGGGPWSSAVIAAINNAVTNGRVRNGISLGCTVVFASGNNYATAVSYPANLANVIAVGAINRNGIRADFSNHGAELDVVAPGVDIYTTDIRSSSGYNTSSGATGDYYDNFDGTSAACPYVAGIAALILSAKPDLTQHQVRRAIEENCTKPNGYSFMSNTSHPYGTWNNQVGHGLVNAYAAVYSVAPPPIIAGPNEVCYSGSSFTLDNPPTGVITWSVTGPFSISGTGITATVTRTGTGTDSGTLTAIVNGAAVASKTISPCAPPTIVGLSTTCGSSVSYSISGLPPSIQNTDIQWTCDEHLTPQGGVYGKSKTFTKVEDGTGWVKATIQLLNSLSLTKDIVLTFPDTKPYTMQRTNCGAQFQIYPVASGTYRWELSHGQSSNYILDTPNPQSLYARSAYVSFSDNGTWEISAYIENGCGESPHPTYTYPFVVLDCHSRSSGYAYPNPVDDILMVDLDAMTSVNSHSPLPATKINKSASMYDVRLYDSQGNLLRQQNTKGGNVQFNVVNLPNGIYYLHIYDGRSKLPEMQQIVVEH